MTYESWNYDKNGFIDDYTMKPETNPETTIVTSAGTSKITMSMLQSKADGTIKDCFCYLTIDECESLICVLKEHLESIANR